MKNDQKKEYRSVSALLGSILRTEEERREYERAKKELELGRAKWIKWFLGILRNEYGAKEVYQYPRDGSTPENTPDYFVFAECEPNQIRALAYKLNHDQRFAGDPKEYTASIQFAVLPISEKPGYISKGYYQLEKALQYPIK